MVVMVVMMMAVLVGMIRDGNGDSIAVVMVEGRDGCAVTTHSAAG